MRLRSTLLFASAPSLLAVSALGQSNPLELPAAERTAAMPAFGLLDDIVLYDAPDADTVHAAGATWKASFCADGMTYVPFLGSDAPRNYPVTFEVAEIRVGDRRVTLDGDATVRREGDRVLIDRGAVIEVYDCAPESVEQSFLFPFRAQSGEVVVTLDVRTDLEGRRDGIELEFDGPMGDVRYGAAFAFDEAGRRADVARRFDGQQIELTVPAVFPVEEGNVLTLDPLISTRAISQPGHSARTADVAFEKDVDGGGAYYVVYERFFSSGDTDAYVASFDPVSGVVSSPEALDISSDSWRNVRIAANDGNDQFLVVAEVEPAAGGNRRICGRLIEEGVSVGSVFSVNGSAGTRDAFLPDVGGERVPFTGSGYFVVWEETGLFDRGNIMGRVVNANGALPGDDIAISASWAVDEGAPRISATTGEYLAGPSLFNLAWELDAPTGRRIRAAQVRFDGVITQEVFNVTPAGIDSHSPSVTSTHPDPLADVGTRPFLIAYTEERPDGGDVMLAVCDENGALGLHNLSAREGVAFSTDQQDPAIAETGDNWIVAYSEFDAVGVLRLKTYMMTVHLTETGGAPDVALAERHVLLSASPAVPHSEEPAIASEAEMGGATDDALIVWGDRNATAPIFSGIRAAHVDAHSSTGAIGIQYCQPEYNSTAETGWLSAFGSQAPSGLKVLTGSDLPPFSISFFLAATQPADVLQPGGSVGRLCVGGSIGRYSAFAAQTTANGTTFMLLNPTQIAQPGGPTAATTGERWYFQLWHRDSVGGQSVSNLSNAIAIDFR